MGGAVYSSEPDLATQGLRVRARVMTVGEAEFDRAAALQRAGMKREATAEFETLRAEYRGSWIDRQAQERLAQLRADGSANWQAFSSRKQAIATKYPGDVRSK
jgi:hypothetical protein